MPTRNSSASSRARRAFQARTASWNLTANHTARVALENSAMNPSPVCLKIRAPCRASAGANDIAAQCCATCVRAGLVVGHVARVIDHIGGDDDGEPPGGASVV